MQHLDLATVAFNEALQDYQQWLLDWKAKMEDQKCCAAVENESTPSVATETVASLTPTKTSASSPPTNLTAKSSQKFAG